MSLPCEQSDDGASLAPRDLDARRARSFFQVRDLRLQIGDLFGELLLARRFGFRLGPRALSACPWALA
mgnify:CR=1 FL=1